MPKLPKSVIKTFFEKNDIPTETQFGIFIDSNLNLIDDRKYLGLKVYDPTVVYEVNDTAIYNGLVYRATAITTGVFDPTKWEKLTFGAVNYVGTWDANSNIPALADGVGNKGDYFLVNVAGNTPLGGETEWNVRDWAVYDGAIWQKVDNSDLDSQVAIVITYAQLAALKSTGTMKPGQLYFISDRRIWIQALNNSRLALRGHYQAVNADYQNTGGNNVGVWSDALTGLTANVSIAIWDGLHWRNLTGNVGSQPNGDAVNWELRTPSEDTTYVSEVDAIAYDFDEDFIYERLDKRSNLIRTIKDPLGQLGNIPMEFFQWGRDGVQGNIAVNAILNNINSVPVIAERRIECGYSNFEVTVSITNSNVLNLSTFGNEGIVYLTSTNPAETLTSCNDAPSRQSFELRPVAGLTVTLVHGTGSGQFKLNGGTNVLLDGNNGDWIRLEMRGSVLYQISGNGGAGGYTSETGITAFAGGGQASAYQLSAEFSKIDTVASAGDSVKTIPARVNKRQVILNNGANDCDVFPVPGENFDGLPADLAVNLSAGMSMELFCFTNGTWTIIG